jgi:hypothetical protein
MLDHAVGPNVIKRLNEGFKTFLEKHGFSNLEDFRGSRRDRVVLQSQIRRPSDSEYAGGYEQVEGYASPSETESTQATA